HARDEGALMLKMLWRLLRSHLRPYKRELWLVVLFQGCQTIATLMLPTLNANIIDKGVVPGNTHYIWSEGALMLGITFVQVCFAIAAVYFGSRAAMGFGRDVRRSLFHTVTDYSAREVAGCGASCLITRDTNDVQPVQMLEQMSCTLLIAAPMMIVGGVILAVRE